MVYIEDLSSNGTYLNQRLIGKNKQAILKSNDEIGLAQITKKGEISTTCLLACITLILDKIELIVYN